MAATTGSFGPGTHKLCTAMSRRSGERCKGIAVATSPNQKCRMHGGAAGHAIGTNNAAFVSGRYSKYLPADLDRLYVEAKSNPDLLEMADHIALLEARMQSVLAESTAEGTAPKWSDIAEVFAEIETALLMTDTAKVISGMEAMHAILDSGIRWDKTWVQVTDLMEQLRKMTETEIKRKKELNQMIPVERVVILMALVGTAVKRHVKDPDEVEAVRNEISMLIGSNEIPATGASRVGSDVIDVGQSVRQIKGKKRDAEKDS